MFSTPAQLTTVSAFGFVNADIEAARCRPHFFYGSDSGAHLLFTTIGNTHVPSDLAILEVGDGGDGWR